MFGNVLKPCIEQELNVCRFFSTRRGCCSLTRALLGCGEGMCVWTLGWVVVFCPDKIVLENV